SRRRHTTAKRDWSSDVCSSDLNPEYNQTIIPHYNIDNILIGIRVRNWRSVEKGKYLPLYHKGEGYQHALGYNLYGIHLNKEAIQIGRASCREREERTMGAVEET